MIDLTKIIHDAADAACPGACVSIGSFGDKSTWRLTPPDGATQQQIDAATAAMRAVDLSPAAQASVEAAREKADADRFATSGDPVARANRAMARVVYASIVEQRLAFNALLDLLVSGADITPAVVAGLRLKNRSWLELLAAVKAKTAVETDPTV